MNKKTKTILAVALVGGVGYYMWMKSKSSPKVNAAGREYQNGPCRCHTSSSNGMYNCGDGTHFATSSMASCKGRPNQAK
jgi:hypothetical protein